MRDPLRLFFDIPKGKAAKIPKVGPKLLAIRESKDELLRKADDLIATSEKKGFEIHTHLEPKFPQRLKAQEDGPVLLFLKGKADLNFERTVGIVGTRSATSYGKSATKRIIEDLAVYQPAIISGLAYGIDIEAHRAAIQAGLPTVAIMGSPIDQIYPAVHRKNRRTTPGNRSSSK